MNKKMDRTGKRIRDDRTDRGLRVDKETVDRETADNWTLTSLK